MWFHMQILLELHLYWFVLYFQLTWKSPIYYFALFVVTGYQKATDFGLVKIVEFIYSRNKCQIPSSTRSFSGIGYPSPARKLLLQVLSFLTKVLTTNKKISLSVILLYCQMVHGTSRPVNCGCFDKGLVKLPGVKKRM